MSEPLITARDLSVRFENGSRAIHALDEVTLQIRRGETLAMVGESGSGKTTLGRALLRLVKPHAGSVWFEGREITELSRRQMRPLRRRMQAIFQDAHGSLSPRRTVGQSLAEPLIVHEIGSAAERPARISALLDRVGLPEEIASRFPGELSGGQRQRVGIARALAVEPELIVADEPISALDASVQAQIINLLVELQAELRLTYLFISHDLNAVRYLADRVAVMYFGRLVELAPADALFERPLHPYTQALVAATPRLGGARPPAPTGEPPSPIAPPRGCAFEARCPYAMERCRRERPTLREAGGREVACFLVEGAPAEKPA